jgi:hypothetical protein
MAYATIFTNSAQSMEVFELMYSRFLFVLLILLGLVSRPAIAVQRSADKDDDAKEKHAQHQKAKHKEKEEEKEEEGEEEEEGGSNKGPSLDVVPLDRVVITIDGYCGDNPLVLSKPSRGGIRPKLPAKSAASASDQKPCQTLVTRAQFETLTNALSPSMPAMLKREVATAYPRLLLFGQKAHELGLDQTPEYKEKMKWASMQALANNLTQEVQERSNAVSETEIKKYYRSHPEEFEQAELLRIIVPKNKQHPRDASGAAPANIDTAADQAELKAEAEKVHARAVAGDDFYKLQKEAYDLAGFQSVTPSVQMGKVTRASIPPAHQKIFEMKAGQVSELFSDAGGYYIYKVLSKQPEDLDDVSQQIREKVKLQKMQNTMEKLVNSIKPTLNEAYFGPEPPDQATQRAKDASSR